jgi:hypothetical protein
MKRKYVIEGLADECPLCIEGEGRPKEKRPPVFVVSCEGGYSGVACAPHLVRLIKAGEGGPATSAPPKPEPRAERAEQKAEAKPTPAVAAPAGNGPPK